MTNEESHPFQLTAEKLEAALQRAEKQVVITVSSDFRIFLIFFYVTCALGVKPFVYLHPCRYSGAGVGSSSSNRDCICFCNLGNIAKCKENPHSVLCTVLKLSFTTKSLAW